MHQAQWARQVGVPRRAKVLAASLVLQLACWFPPALSHADEAAFAASPFDSDGENPAVTEGRDRLASFIQGGTEDSALAPGPPRGGVGVVILDPGHGGDSVGARGATGTVEKDLVLVIAQKIKDLVEERLGLRVLLTRTADYPVDLHERSAAANAIRDGLFISLHAGAGFRPDLEGFEVYAMAYPGRPAAWGTAGGGLAGGAPGREGALMAPIPWDRAQEDFLPESRDLAARIQRSLASSLSASDRGVRRAPLAVLAGVRMPAVLVEIGYLTNPEQEIRLNRATYQDQLAEAVVLAIADHNRSRILGGGELLR